MGSPNRFRDRGLSRLRRDSSPPWSVQRELDLKPQYRRQIIFDAAGHQFLFRYRTTKRRGLLDEDDSLVHAQSIFGWIVDRENRLGALHFIEWFVDIFADPDSFLEEMDLESSEAVALAHVILSNWDLEELAGYGGILEFRLAWMTKEAAQQSVWAAAAEHIIKRRRRSEMALLLLKAFPLEYEGEAPEGSVAAAALAFRRNAMIRHYKRVLGVETLLGGAGAEGWMWRPLTPGVPAPAARSEF